MNKRIKHIIVIAAVLSLLIFTFGACGGGGGGSDAPPADTGSSAAVADTGSSDASATPATVYEWDWLKTCALDNPSAIVSLEFAEKVKEATNGQLVITVRASGELPFKLNEYLLAVGNGSLAMADANVGAVSQDMDSAAIPALPYLIQDYDQLKSTMDVLQSKIDEELGAYGVTIVGYHNWPNQQVWGNGTPPTTFAELNGYRVRTQGIEQSEALQMDGVIPQSIDYAEVATAVSRGTINGNVTAGITMLEAKFYEVMNWGFLIDLQALPIYLIVNEDMLAELPDDVRETFLTMFAEYAAYNAPRMVDYEIDAQKQLTDFGMTINTPSDADKVAKMEEAEVYWIDWAEARGGTTPEDLQAVRDAIGK